MPATNVQSVTPSTGDDLSATTITSTHPQATTIEKVQKTAPDSNATQINGRAQSNFSATTTSIPKITATTRVIRERMKRFVFTLSFISTSYVGSLRGVLVLSVIFPTATILWLWCNLISLLLNCKSLSARSSG